MKRIFLCLMVLEFGAVAWSAGADTAPNFVVIMAEAQGWPNTSVRMDDRLPASKSAVFKTPAVERLAREGMRFAYGYALSPRCTPSRAALFTGIGPAALGMTYVGVGRESGPVRTALIPPEPVLELPTAVTTVAEMLKGAGYTTAHLGKWHVGRTDPAKHGFDESDGATGNGGPDNVASPNPKQAYGMTERGVAFMTRAQKTGKPFYLQLSHYPNQERKEGGGGGRDRDTVRAEADEIDRTVLQLLGALDTLGLTGRTYVIYTADHGGQGRNGNAPLAGGKGAVTEGGLRVPFLIRGPGIAGDVCSRVPVTACDVWPTIAELAGVRAPLPAAVEGGALRRCCAIRRGGAPSRVRGRNWCFIFRTTTWATADRRRRFCSAATNWCATTSEKRRGSTIWNAIRVKSATWRPACRKRRPSSMRGWRRI